MMKKLLLYISALILSVGSLRAQEERLSMSDLTAAYENSAETDTAKLYYCFLIAQNSTNSDSVEFFAQKAVALAAKNNNTEAEAKAYGLLATVSYEKNNFDYTLNALQKQSVLAEKAGNNKLLADAYFSMADCYHRKNDQKLAMELYRKAVKIYSSENDSLRIADVYLQIGDNCQALGLYKTAYENIRTAIKIYAKSGATDRKARAYASLANLLAANSDEYYDVKRSLDSVKKAKIYADSIPVLLKDTPQNRNAYNIYYMVETQIYLLYYQNGGSVQPEYLASADFFREKLYATSFETGNAENICFAKILMAKILLLKGRLKEAVVEIDRLKSETSERTKWLKNISLIYRTSAEIYAETGDFRQAYEDYCKYVSIKKQYSENLSLNADFRSDLRSEAEFYQLKEENSRQMLLQANRTKIVVVILVLVAIFATVIFFLFRRNRKNYIILDEKNHRLNQQQQEILAQRNVIDDQRAAVEKANVEIYQSISYAKHIQQAALPGEDTVKSFFPDSFVYYVPKDIVSGDFYYVTQNSGYNIFVLGDCTGHGVPGGFLSMLGISAIKDLLKNPEIDILPGIMLDMMREYIKSALANDEFYTPSDSPDGEDETFSTADGMDMSICAIDVYNYKLRFAGAYQSAYIVRDGEIIRLKGDRMPVGRHINEKPNFTTLYFDVAKDDMIYMQSDGIESQIGFTGQKFMTKRLKEFFLKNYRKPCKEQKEAITKIMEDWIFGTIQVDDLSMAGIRIQ